MIAWSRFDVLAVKGLASDKGGGRMVTTAVQRPIWVR